VGRVAVAAAPQFAFEEGVVVVVVVDVFEDVSVDSVHAAAWAVPPTVANRMTRPSRATTNTARGTASRSATFFTCAPRS
jgi:hypothetical protein